MTFKKLLGTIALGSALVVGMTGMAQASGRCFVELGKVVKVVVEPHRPAKVYISPNEALPKDYYRFYTDDDRVLTQVGSAHAGNHTVFVRGSQSCRPWDKTGYHFEGGHIEKFKVYSRQ